MHDKSMTNRPKKLQPNGGSFAPGTASYGHYDAQHRVELRKFLQCEPVDRRVLAALSRSSQDSRVQDMCRLLLLATEDQHNGGDPARKTGVEGNLDALLLRRHKCWLEKNILRQV
jgi:hypothetical protein